MPTPNLTPSVFLVAVTLSAAPPEAALSSDSQPIIVTAGRTGDPVESFGGTVIGEERINTLQPVSTLDLLDRAAGVRAFEKGGAGGPSYLSIRRAEPKFHARLGSLPRIASASRSDNSLARPLS